MCDQCGNIRLQFIFKEMRILDGEKFGLTIGVIFLLVILIDLAEGFKLRS